MSRYARDPVSGSILPVAGGGSGGHAILDEEDMSYPSRSKLQFEGCQVTDDAINNTTIIKCEGGSITKYVKPTITVGTYTYDGTEKAPTITGFVPDGMSIIGDYEAVNVGNYTFSITLKDKTSSEWTDDTTEDVITNWSIDAISIAVPTVTNTTKNYSGSAQSPTITRDTANTFVNGTTSATKVKSNYSFSIALNDTTYHKWSDNTTAAKSYTWNIIPPVGSQYTPVNDIQAWLQCASIDKTYTTIAQVLEDATTLSALMLSNNAANYLVRSTSWVSNITSNQTAMTDIGASDYCADTLLADSTWRTAICNSEYFESVLTKKVPVMTSNTTPSGIAFADSAYDSSYGAYRMFAGMSGHGWSPYGGSNTLRCGYQFTSPITVYKVAGAIAPKASYATKPTTVKCYGSNDGSNWTILPIDSVQFQNVNSFIYTNVNSVPPQYTYISFYGYFDDEGQGYRAQIWGR